MRASWLRGVVGLGLLAAAASTGCGAHHESGFAPATTTPKALPLDAFPASAIMTQKYGIVEWRFFAGRTQRIVTGYRADGSAARGIQLAWFRKTATSDAHMRMMMLDGTGTAVRRSSTGAVTGTLTPLQAELLIYSAYDSVRNSKGAQGEVLGKTFAPGREAFEPGSLRSGTLHPLDVPQNAASCGAQMSGTWTNGVTCAEGFVSAPATVVWGLVENLPGELQGNLGGLDQKLTDSIDTPCLGFFNNYANSLSACAPAGCILNPDGPMICGLDGGTASNDDGGMQVASNDEAGNAGDDASGASGDDSSANAGDDGGDNVGDDSGGGGAGDDGGTEVAMGDDGGSTGDDTTGDDGGASDSDDPPTDQEIDTASNDATCPSCQDGASDVSANPANGDVTPTSSSDPDTSNTSTSDTSDDPSGGSGSSGSDNGGSSGGSTSSSSSGGQSSEDQPSQDQPSQDQGQPSQDQGQPSQDQPSQDQPSQDQPSQDQSQDQSQDESAIRRRHHGHKPSGWSRLYTRITGWLAQ